MFLTILIAQAQLFLHLGNASFAAKKLISCNRKPFFFYIVLSFLCCLFALFGFLGRLSEDEFFFELVKKSCRVEIFP